MKERNWLDLVRPKSLEKSVTELITTVTLEPFERGFGFTVGTALRASCSPPGAAITAVRVDCATFDGSSIEGIDEPLEAVILNMKKLAFRAVDSFRSARLRVALDRPGLLASGDIACGDGLNAAVPDQPVARSSKALRQRSKSLSQPAAAMCLPVANQQPVYRRVHGNR